MQSTAAPLWLIWHFWTSALTNKPAANVWSETLHLAGATLHLGDRYNLPPDTTYLELAQRRKAARVPRGQREIQLGVRRLDFCLQQF